MQTMFDLIRTEVAPRTHIDDFIDMLHAVEFKYTTEHLLKAGLRVDDLNMAINNAIKSCRLNGIDTEDHFRICYIFAESDQSVHWEWRFTKEGFTLIMMNAPCMGPTMAKWQWMMVNSLIS